VLTATALSVLVPLLKDTGQITTPFGQLVIAAATIVDFGTILLLSLLFSREATRLTILRRDEPAAEVVVSPLCSAR
jgi:Kef-type K+ transport system membrane component KefB